MFVLSDHGDRTNMPNIDSLKVNVCDCLTRYGITGH